MPPSKAKKANWVDGVDFNRALKNCHLDFLGDWYRDPWGWVELDWAVDQALDELVKPRLHGQGVGHVSRLDVAKENFGIRPAVVMDPLDRLCYQALVDGLSKRVSSSLPAWVCGWRLGRESPEAGKYERQDNEWEAYRWRLRTLAAISRAALKTDIVSFFASIPVDRLAEDILDTGKSAMAERLVDMMRAFDAVHGRSGLPQRSAASALLANGYLQPLDDLLNSKSALKGLARVLSPTGRVLRWMDDIWVFGQSAGELRKIQLEIHEAMRSLGLNLNTAKTDVLEGDDVQREANRIEHSAVDSALSETPMDQTPLEELVERLLDDPEHADRTSVRFVTKRMRDHDLYDQVDDFAEKAPRMPQASDALARLFRDSGSWSGLQDWYVEYCKTDWAAIDWSVAQLGTMFPSAKSGSDSLKEFLAGEVDGTSLAMTALSAQRLAYWDKDLARQAIREAADNADNPQIRRVLALAAISAGEKRAAVRKLLGEFEENRITLRMLEDTNFRKPKVTADFYGS
jgi:hypothetical protein